MRWRLIAGMAALVVVTIVATTIVREVLSDEPGPGANHRPHSLTSAVLDETREYTVAVPQGYAADDTRRYPVLYVLDGLSQVAHTTDSAALMTRIGVTPGIIVVGVSNMGAAARDRDYTPPGMLLDTENVNGGTGSGDRFLAFLRDELIPAVESEYRTTGPRMLAGWSRGGLFVVYSLIAAPELFEARFAHSPALWREHDAMVNALEQALATPRSSWGFLFLSLGDHENEKMTAAFGRAAAMLERIAPPALRWRAMLSEGGTHETNPRLATPVGLFRFLAPVDIQQHSR